MYTITEIYILLDVDKDDGNLRPDANLASIDRDCTLEIALVRGADTTRYGTLIPDLANQYSMGQDSYPNDMTGGYSILVIYKTPSNTSPQQRVHHHFSDSPSQASGVFSISPASGVIFAQQQKFPLVPGSDGILHPAITCYQCHGSGQYSSACPTPSCDNSSLSPGTTHLQYVLAQTSVDGIHPRFILLDSQSIISVFMNPRMLSNISPSPHPLRAIYNGGHQDSAMIDDFPVLGPVW
jgi:hypothetical protein